MESCAMSEGYQIVEPACLGALVGDPKCQDLAILILHWVAAEANARRTLPGGTVEVLKVTYMGSYPALGVRGQSPDASADETDVRLAELAEELVRSGSVAGLIAHATSTGIHWRDFSRSMMGT